MQKDLKEGLVSELKPIREEIKNLPKAIIFPQLPSIAAYNDDDDGEEEEDVFIGDIAEEYLRKCAPVLITAMMSELVLKCKTYVHILARAT